MADKKIHLKILTQDGPDARSQWEEFDVDYTPGMNVISCLMAIQQNPVNSKGQNVRPVVWECNCLEEICGACTMNIHGTPRQARTPLVDQLKQPIELRPLTKFPVIRDLMVDRMSMFDGFRKVKAWVPIDGTYALGPGPKMSEEDQERAYALARCIVCGCCMESCPQYGNGKAFLGPSILSQANLFNINPTGKMNMKERMKAVTGKGGVQTCGNAQNCVRACPKQIPITDSIAELGRQATKKLLKDILG